MLFLIYSLVVQLTCAAVGDENTAWILPKMKNVPRPPPAAPPSVHPSSTLCFCTPSVGAPITMLRSDGTAAARLAVVGTSIASVRRRTQFEKRSISSLPQLRRNLITRLARSSMKPHRYAVHGARLVNCLTISLVSGGNT